MGLRYGGAILDRDFDWDDFPIDIQEDWGQDWDNLIRGRHRTPRDLRNFSITKRLKRKDGEFGLFQCQKAASAVRNIPVTPALNAKYLQMDKEEIEFNRTWKILGPRDNIRSL